MKVEIGTVHTTLEVQEPVGALSPEEVRRLVQLMMERLRDERWREARLKEDREIRSRSYIPDSEREAV
jgi:hypothetical protein